MRGGGEGRGRGRGGEGTKDQGEWIEHGALKSWGVETGNEAICIAIKAVLIEGYSIQAEPKISAGYWPFSMQSSTMATYNLITMALNWSDGQLKFQFWPAKPKVLFSALYKYTPHECRF